MWIRKQRGLSQKIYLIESISVSEYVKKFNVCGTTGNVYTVSIKETPICTCPDHMVRRRRCKHIYFVLLRVLKVKYTMMFDDDNSIDEDQEVYSQGELERMFNNCPRIVQNIMVNEQAKRKYNQIKNNMSMSKHKEKREQETCPVCLDDMDEDDELDYCKFHCGNPIHIDCFKMWCRQRGTHRCVYCNNPWNKEVKYMNLKS